MLENFSCISLILPFAFYETINNKSGKCFINLSRPLLSPSRRIICYFQVGRAGRKSAMEESGRKFTCINTH